MRVPSPPGLQVQIAGWEGASRIHFCAPGSGRAGKFGFSGGSWMVMGTEETWPRDLQAARCVQSSDPASADKQCTPHGDGLFPHDGKQLR